MNVGHCESGEGARTGGRICALWVSLRHRKLFTYSDFQERIACELFHAAFSLFSTSPCAVIILKGPDTLFRSELKDLHLTFRRNLLRLLVEKKICVYWMNSTHTYVTKTCAAVLYFSILHLHLFAECPILGCCMQVKAQNRCSWNPFFFFLTHAMVPHFLHAVLSQSGILFQTFRCLIN